MLHVNSAKKTLFPFFPSLAYAFHSLIKLLKWTLWISKEHNNYSYPWKFEPDKINSFGQITFEKLESLQRMYGLINVFATQQFRSFRRLFSLLLLALARRTLWVNFYANEQTWKQWRQQGCAYCFVNRNGHLVTWLQPRIALQVLAREKSYVKSNLLFH